VDAEARISAPPERVFEVLADVERWPDWTFPDEAGRERDGSPEPDGRGAIRRFRTGRRLTREEVVTFERPSAFSYVLLEGIAVRNYRGDVTIEPDGDGGSVVRWHSTFDPKVPGTGWLWRSGFRRLLRRIVADLAAAAGSPKG
jgi:uncharacterized protein YndB with AHSA1/START domain